MDVESKLKDLTNKINLNQEERRRLEGEKISLTTQRDELMRRLESEYGIKTVEEASEEIKRLEAEMAESEAKISEYEKLLDEVTAASV